MVVRLGKRCLGISFRRVASGDIKKNKKKHIDYMTSHVVVNKKETYKKEIKNL
jgi:hypothetical protein